MNAKKVKQLRKVAKSLAKVDNSYNKTMNGNLELNKFCEKSLMKELKKSFK